ncbi:MAG: biopolymer transporter ExbD [Chthoniobacterales bacterium]|nr:biopolymer transporter ExbD [Chthoniobacterales bacterium]
MRRFSSHTALHTLSELNVTPLLDLAFVLLIIFMITTPLLENSMDLVVPTSATARQEVNPSKVQIISIDRNQTLKLNQEVCSLEQLEVRLRALKTADPQIAVIIRPHKDLPIQQFVTIMDMLKKINVTKVGVMTREAEDHSNQ